MKKWAARFYDGTGVIKLPIRVMLMACIFIILLVGSSFLYYHSPEENYWLICTIYKLTGFYCPGCGSGRACYCILHGRFAQAFRYNPLLCILLPWIALYIGACGIQWLLAGKETVSRRIPIEVTYVLLAIVILYGMLRNIEIYPFTLLAPTRIG